MFKNIKDRIKNISYEQIGIAYGVIALITFGVASHIHRVHNIEAEAFHDAQCGTVDDRIAIGISCYSTWKDYNPDILVGFASGIFWPLYWTDTLFDVILPGGKMPKIVTKTEKVYVQVPESDSDSTDSDSAE